VLFLGNKSRDAAKAGLLQLGYEEPLIANTIIRVMLLRARLDAAHVRLADLTWDERARQFHVCPELGGVALRTWDVAGI
jgi:hypothetical protein